MTWVKGTTTWGALEHLLAQLACGEVADGSAVTVQSSDRWVREVTRSVTDGVLNSTTTITSATAAFTATDVGSLVIGTGITLGTTIASVTNSTTAVLSAAATASASGVSLQICTNTIRTPAAKDVASGSMSCRTGYFLNCGISAGTGLVSGTAGQNTVCRVTSPCSSDPSTGGFHRWLVQVRVSIANTVSGNYSTAQLAYTYYDADTAAVVGSGTVTPNAAGSATLASGLVVSVTDPGGFLTLNTYFVRAFSATYMYGVDAWPMYHRATAGPTFTANPPGAAGTDYDVIALAYPASTSLTIADRANLFHGLGIKTSTGLGAPGALYTLSFPMALIKMRIFAGATAGVLSLDLGQSKKDAANSTATFRCCGGLRITGWAKAFTTPGSVSASSALQYFASITADGIALVLNGDPGSTGKLGTAWIGAFTPTDPTYDVFPVAFSYNIADYSGNIAGNDLALGAQYGYWGLRRRQDGSEGSRDWQTKWMRGEHLTSIPNTAGMLTAGADVASTAGSPVPTASQIPLLVAVGASTDPLTYATQFYLPTRQNKPAPDGKWWLYGFQYAEGYWGSSNEITVDENRFVRGTQQTRYAYVPETGWASGDELTDSVSGTKYLLVVPDFAGLGGRLRGAASTYYGGMAIAEV